VLADLYVTYAKKAKRSWETDQRHLDHFVSGWPDASGTRRLAAWGKRAAASIARGDISEALDRIATGAPVSANRHQSTLHRMFNWAIGEGKWPDGKANPMRGMEKRTDESDRQRERNLSPAELKTVWTELTNPSSEIGGTTRDALRVILLTAQRPGEVSGMLSEELKLNDEPTTWTLPKARAKNKVGEHVIPLTAPALNIIKANLADRENPVAVFESRTFGDRPMSRHTLPHACADIAVKLGIEHFVAHDLRRTAATLMRAAGVPPFVVEDVLGHLPTKLVRTYQAHDPVPERFAALETLARRIREISS
jgi:integrase